MLDELNFERRHVPRVLSLGDEGYQFRLPVGADQELAASAGLSDPAQLRDWMLARCLNRSFEEVAVIDPALKDAIELRMEQAAPDITPELEALCPECGNPFTAALDLCFLAMRELKVHSYRLEQEVHLLAWYYKWSERDILALPRNKRARYVRMVREELETRSAV